MYGWAAAEPHSARSSAPNANAARCVAYPIINPSVRRELFFLSRGFLLAVSVVRTLRPYAGSRSRHHSVVDAVRAVVRLEPRIAAEVVGVAADGGLGAAGWRRRIDPAHRVRRAGRAADRDSGRDAGGVDGRGIGTAGGDAGTIRARCGGGVGASGGDTG